MVGGVTQYGSVPWEVFTVDGVFGEGEARRLTEWVDSKDMRERKFSFAEFKNGKIKEPELAGRMWERIGRVLGDEYVDTGGERWEWVGACDNVMYAVVRAGQGFPIHTDTGCVWEGAGDVRSRFTVLVYLNDGFAGGRTVFYDKGFHVTAEVEPRAGMAVVFDIDMFHAGEEVREGVKHWVGTEIVCRRAGT